MMHATPTTPNAATFRGAHMGIRALAVICGFVLMAIIAATASWANPSIRETLPAARAGDARAQYIVGMMYLFGQDTRQDIPEGVRWLEPSARAGLPQAMVALAGLYDVGQGVPLDTERATQLRQQAAQAGDPTARGQISDDRTLPGQRDFRRASILTDLHLNAAALPYARKAADAGSRNGQLLLGRAYHFGLGVPVDKAAAFRLYQKSADGGLADGLRAVGYMYEFGEGIQADRKRALEYYDRAAAKGSALARQAAANLRSPDYDQPRSGGTGGGAGSQSNNFRQFQCTGSGGRWNGSSCYSNNGSGPIINP
jgi:TPR repeat protein